MITDLYAAIRSSRSEKELRKEPVTVADPGQYSTIISVFIPEPWAYTHVLERVVVR